MSRAAVCVLLLALAGCAGSRQSLVIEPSSANLRADGVSTVRISVSAAEVSALVVEGQRRIRVESITVRDGRSEILLRAGVLSGAAVVELRAPERPPAAVRVSLSEDLGDADQDGLPDILALTDQADRDAFVRWFTFLAEAQYFAEKLPADVSDCAGLVRFAYRESLREHDAQWARSLRLPATRAIAAVRKYNYPYTPLGAALFRVPAKGGGLPFAEFADAETLMRLNTAFISPELEEAKPGDLLFFRQLEQNLPWHVMVYLGASRIELPGEPLVVYHTGPIGDWPGEIRRPPVKELLRHPSPRWRPVAGNSNFLGVFRWNILKDS